MSDQRVVWYILTIYYIYLISSKLAILASNMVVNFSIKVHSRFSYINYISKQFACFYLIYVFGHKNIWANHVNNN